MPAHGRAGARATSFSYSYILLVPPPSEKIAGGFQQAGKKEGGLGKINFCPPAFRAKGAARVGSGSFLRQQEDKARKIVSLKEKIFCARPLKEKEICAGFVRRQTASRWGGFLPVRVEILAQKRFALRSVIATNQDISFFQGKEVARSAPPQAGQASKQTPRKIR